MAASFPSVHAAEEAITRLGVEYGAVTLGTALVAGDAWKTYRARGGQRTRVVADFLVGAHALTAADRLLTRDRGFHRSYFRRLRVLDPAS